MIGVMIHGRRVGAPCRLAVLLAAVCLLFGAVGPADAKTETAESGNVTASLTYTGTFGNFSPLNVTIWRGDFDSYDEVVSVTDCDEPFCGPVFGGQSAIDAVDLNGDGDPEVVVSVYTGGAHCCVVADIFRWTGADYTQRGIDFGDPGFRIVQLDHRGAPEFLTADYRFRYRFASFASSGMPLRILRFEDGALTDVTRQFPQRLRRDARMWFGFWSKWRRTRDAREARGALAAWAADQYLLGRRRSVLRQIGRAADSGVVPGGRRWLRDLDGFLSRLGYRHEH